MRQRRLDDLAWVVRLLRRPVPERRAEAMRNGREPVLLEQPAQTLVVKGLAAPGREHDPASAAERPRRGEDLQGAAAQRNPVLALHLHPRGRNRPHAAGKVDLTHSASRTSPQRAAVSTRNSNARLAPGNLGEDRTISTAAATSWWGSARMCSTTCCCLPSTAAVPQHHASPGERHGQLHVGLVHSVLLLGDFRLRPRGPRAGDYAGGRPTARRACSTARRAVPPVSRSAAA